jgi:PAS domain S-box-containing protein
MQENFQFNIDQFNRIFPFYFTVNEKLEIFHYGKSLKKLNVFANTKIFTQLFSIPRPFTEINNINDLKALEKQLVVLELSADKSIKLRGQFEILADKNEIIFIGTPWFNTIEQVTENKLVINDFAHHDPIIDLLHIAKSYQLNNDDLTNLLTTINKQKKELKRVNKEIEEIALFPTQNPDPLIRINFDGEVIRNNPAAAHLDFMEYNNEVYRNDVFFELVSKEIDLNKARWIIDIKANNKDYSFVCIPMLDYKYINIYGREITQQKKDQQEIEKLSLIIQKTNNAVIITDVTGGIEWVNEAFEKITEYSLSEIKGKKPGSFLQGAETDTNSVEYMRTNISAKKSFTCEILNYSKTNKIYWLRINAQPIFNNLGDLVNYFAIEEDITTEKEAQYKLEQQRVFYEQILDNIPSDIAVLSNNHTYLYLNPIAVKDENLRKWLIGKTDEDYVREKNKPPALLEKRKKVFKEVTKSKILKSWEEIIQLPNGESKTILRHMFPVLNNKNKIELLIGYGMDITEIKNIQHQIELSEKKYKDVIENSLAIITTHDLDGKFLTANPMVTTAYGYQPCEVVGKSIIDFLPKSDIKYFKSVYLKNIVKNKKVTGIFRIVNKNGEIVYTLYNNFLKEDEGEKPYVIGFAVDITERIKIEEELKLAKKVTEELAQSKQNFLANMSHEIRTPMNAIMGMANQLNKTNLLPRQQFYLGNIQLAADNLLVIINDILDSSKIEAGKLVLENIGFELNEIISKAMQVMLHKAEEKGIALTSLKFEKNIASVFIGDPYRINQILLNLLSNAIKFTEKGSVNIDSKIVKKEANKQWIAIHITDTGIGMDESFSKNIFQKFNQEDESVTRKFGGTGLGMSICKELVELMNGTIVVKSKKGKGTSVICTLPLQIGNMSDLPIKTKVKINSTLLENKKILVVDDNEMNRLVASTLLENYKVHVIEACNGLEAIEKIRKSTFDLVLMDVQMPIMDGIEATKIIKETITKDLPIIALTAFAIKGDKENIIAAGMNDYISKPFEEIKFIEIVTKWLHQNPNLEIKTEPKVNFSLHKLQEIANGNKDFITKMIHLFITQAETTILEMNEAYIANDLLRVSKIAHRIKPSIDNMCIIEIKETIRDVELNAIKYGISEDLKSKLQKIEITLLSAVDQLKQNL